MMASRRRFARAGVSIAVCVAVLAGSARSAEAPTDRALAYSTLIGENIHYEASGVAVGPDGVVWVATGYSALSSPGYRYLLRSAKDVSLRVLRIDPATHEVLSDARMIGWGEEARPNLVVDPNGNAFVCGRMRTSDSNLSWRPFVAHVLPDGSGFAWVHVFEADDSRDSINSMCLTADGDPVVVGEAWSGGFPLESALNPARSGGVGFVARLRADDGTVVFATRLGSSSGNSNYAQTRASLCFRAPDGGIAVHGDSQTDEIRYASSVIGSGPGGRNYENYLLEIRADGTAITRVARVDASIQRAQGTQDAIVLVTRLSDDLQTESSGLLSADTHAILRLDPATWTVRDGVSLGDWSDSEFSSRLDALAIGDDGTVWIAGSEDSLALPVMGGDLPRGNDARDAYVAAFDPTDLHQIFGGYLGGDTTDLAYALAVAPSGSAWVAGATYFPGFPLVDSAPLGAMPAPGVPVGFLAEVRVRGSWSPPAAPVDVAAHQYGPDVVRVIWSPGDDRAIGFVVDRAEVRLDGWDAGWTQVATLGADAHEWVDVDVSPGRTFRYLVRAVGSKGTSRASPFVEASVWETLRFRVRTGRVRYDWSYRRGNLESIALTGKLSGIDRSGLLAGGLCVSVGDANGTETLVDIRADDARWKTEPTGALSWRIWRTRIRVHPGNRTFALRLARRSEVVNTFNRRFAPPPESSGTTIRVAVGKDAGLDVVEWRGRSGSLVARRTPER